MSGNVGTLGSVVMGFVVGDNDTTADADADADADAGASWRIVAWTTTATVPAH